MTISTTTIINMAVTVSAIMYPPMMLWVAFHSMDKDKRAELKSKIQIAKWVASFLLGVIISAVLFWFELDSSEPFSKPQASRMILIAFFSASWVIGHIVYILWLVIEAHHQVIIKHLVVTEKTISTIERMTNVLDKNKNV